MRLTIILLTVCLTGASASVVSQNVSFSAKKASLKSAIASVKKQTGFVFFYPERLLKISAPVTVHASDVPLEQFLDKLFAQQPNLKYTIKGKTVFIAPKSDPVNTGSDGPAKFTEIVADTLITITGKVVDENNAPVLASVAIKGTKNGTFTNTDGEFTLRNVGKGATLVISGVNIEPTEYKPGGEAVVSISVKSRIAEAESVTIVSTGYQEISKERATGSYSTLSPSTFKQQRLNSLNTLLEGRIAGYNRGLVRGTTTMNGIERPLFVIDGFPVENNRYDALGNIEENLPNLNIEDIESVTVLKDAAAASIYGARAANGVIVIVTKKARKGKPQIGASATITHSPYYYPSDLFADAADMIGLEKEWAAANPNFQGPGAAAYAQSLLDNPMYTSQGVNAYLNFYTGRISEAELNDKLSSLAAGGYQYYDDVRKYAKRNPLYQQYNVNVANASDKNSFYFSATYKENLLEDVRSKDNSIGLNIKNTSTFTKWLNLELGSFVQFSNNKTPSYTVMSPGYLYSPYDRLINDDGSYFVSTAQSRLSANTLNIMDQYDLYNADITPLEEMNRNIGNSKNFLNRSFARLNISFTKWLSYQGSFQYEYANDRFDRLYDKNSYYVRNRVNSFAGYTADKGFFYLLPFGNIYNTANQFTNAYNFRQQLNFDKTFGGAHNVTAILGTETRHSKLESANQTLYNYDPQVLSYDLVDAKSLANPAGVFFGGSFSDADIAQQHETVNRFVSMYGNAAYAFNDKYLFTGSLRWDRSNLWGTDSKYQNKPLWSVGAGWNVHREQFFNVANVNMLKLRTSYGIGGNIAKNSAPYMTAYYNPNFNVGGIEGTIASRPNPLLSWEKTTTFDLGADFGIYNNRITGTIDYYLKKGNDLLANTQGVPTEGFGYSTYTINNGAMTNKGIEATITARIIEGRDFSWTATAMFARNKNKVTYVNIEAPVYFLQLDYPTAFPRIGNPYNSIYTYEWAGLSNTGLPQVYDAEKSPTSMTPTTLESIVYGGTTVPVNSGSFNSSFEYKNFSLSFLLTFESGHKIRNTHIPMLNSQWSSATFNYYTPFTSTSKDIANRWRQPGDENFTNVPRVVFAEEADYNISSYELYYKSSMNILDASNIRLRNISLAYDLPGNLVKRMSLSNARLQFNVENAFTIASSKVAKYVMGTLMRPSYVWGVYLNF